MIINLRNPILLEKFMFQNIRSLRKLNHIFNDTVLRFMHKSLRNYKLATLNDIYVIGCITFFKENVALGAIDSEKIGHQFLSQKG